MIEHIIEIGRAVRERGEDKPIADLWIKDNKPMELLITIDVSSEGTINEFLLSEFDEYCTYIDSLYYQNGNDLKKGSGLAIHDVKALSSSTHKDFAKTFKKAEKKIKYSLDFLELPDTLSSEIMNIVTDTIKDSNADGYFVMITVDGKTPYELFREKFENEIKKSWHKDAKLSKKKLITTCHSCGHVGENYNTAIYNCYNNDKESYSNIYNDIGESAFGYSLCETCIIDLLNGRQFVNENMTTNWLGSNVMFLPHDVNDTILNLYSSVMQIHNDDEKSSSAKLMKLLYKHEARVLRKLDESDTLTDIVFFKSENSYWGITYNIQGILPSKFGRLGDILSKYERVTLSNGKISFFNLGDVFDVLCSQGTQKERLSIMEILLKGTKFNRDKFFSLASNRLKEAYLEYLDKGKSGIMTAQLSKILKTYNVLVENGCLDYKLNIIDEGNGMKMKEFKNQEEFFESNKEFFNNDTKKAWFTLGRIYNAAVYETRTYYDTPKNKTCHLERKKTTLYQMNYNKFVSLIEEYCKVFEKYGKPGAYKNLFLEAYSYLNTFSDKDISSSEAMMIFNWGSSIFFTDNLKSTDNDNIDEEN